jgi:hypothetical protein
MSNKKQGYQAPRFTPPAPSAPKAPKVEPFHMPAGGNRKKP